MTRPHWEIKGFIKLLTQRTNNYYNSTVNDDPFVSIISSFNNADQYFENTYLSVINQTWQNYEWIIVDDCSSKPEAISLFKSLEEKNPKIKTYDHQHHQGVSAARNTAISHAQGKYLFFVDLGDLIDPTYLEKCVLFLETHSDFSFVNSYSVGFESEEYWWENGFNQPSRLIEQNWAKGALLSKKSDFEEIGGFDEKLHIYQDWERWLKALSHGQKGWTIPEYLNCSRRNKIGLLPNFTVTSEEQEEEKNLIQTRYGEYWQENQLENTRIERVSSYEDNPRQKYFHINNNLERSRNGKRVLCFCSYLEIGGADKFNLDWLTQLQQKGYEFTVATTVKSEHPWHHEFYQITPDIFHLTNLLHHCHWLDWTRYIIKSRQIDVVLITVCFIGYQFLPILRNEFPEVAFVDYTHVQDLGWKGLGFPRIASKYSKFLDLHAVSSKHLAELYQQLNPETKDKLRVCYTSVDVNYWQVDHQKGQQIRNNLGISEDKVCLLYPARIVPQKRPLFLVDIVKKLIDQGLTIEVICLGKGYLLPKMKAKIAELGLESVFHLLPPVKSGEMLDFYSAADIMILPSEYEGISIAIYEAMSMELAIVASEVGGQKELLTPETGCLIPKGKADQSELAEYCQALTPFIQNSSSRIAMGKAARDRVVEYFRLEIMGDTMDAIFTEAIEKRQQSSLIDFDLPLAEEALIASLESESLELELHILEKWTQELQGGNNWLLQQVTLITEQLEKTQQLQSQTENLQNVTRQLEDTQAEIDAMKTSKFWKMRAKWFRLKKFFNLSDDNPG